MSTTNKLKNVWISNDTVGITGYSLVNEGFTQLKKKTTIGITGETGQNLVVFGDINYSGNLLKNGSNDIVSLSGNNNFTGQNTFSNFTFQNISSNVPVINYNFNQNTISNNTPLFNNVSGTNSITGWNFSGNGYSIFTYNTGNFSPDNRYIPNLPSPSSTYLLVEVLNGNTFTLSTSNLTLNAGDYTVSWSSYWGAGGIPTATITASIANNSLAYNDGFTRDVGFWTSHSFQFTIQTSGVNNLSFTYTDTGPHTFDACFSNIVITQYNSLHITDGSNTSFISPTLSSIKNPYLSGNTNISGDCTIQGSLTSYSKYGTNNTVLNNTNYSSTQSGATNSNSVIIGTKNTGIGVANSNNILCVGNGLGLANSSSNVILMGNNVSTGKLNDIFIGNNIYTSLGGNNLLIGNSLSSQGGCGQYNVCCGSSMLGAYNGYGYYQSSPAFNIGLGGDIFSNLLDNYNIGIGFSVLTQINGNDNNPSNVSPTALSTKHNIAIGNFSGISFNNLNNCLFLGSYSDASVNNLSNAVAIGYNCKVSQNNTIQLGSNGETVQISGPLTISNNLISSGTTITPSQINFLSNVVSNKISSAQISDIGNYLTNSSLSVPDSCLSSNVPLLSTNNTYTGNAIINGGLYNTTLYSCLLNNTSRVCNQFINQPMVNTFITNATPNSFLTTGVLNEFYTFCNTSNAGITLTLPTINTSNLGTSLKFRRIGGFFGSGNTSATLSLTAPSINQPIYPYASQTANTGTIVALTSTQNYIELRAVMNNITVSGVSSCNTTAGSNQITINSVVSGLVINIGAIITCKSVSNTITSRGTTNGTTGVYTCQNNWPATNTAQTYSLFNTGYAWAVVITN